jgi:hypothetical protein
MTIKKLTLQLAIVSEFFHCPFANPYTMYNQRRSRSGVRLTAQLAIRCLIANWRWHCNFKGLSQDKGWADFSRNLQASLFNDDLSYEPNFGWIHLDGQYL